MKRTLLAVLALTGTLLVGHGSALAQDSATQAGGSQSTQSNYRAEYRPVPERYSFAEKNSSSRSMCH